MATFFRITTSAGIWSLTMGILLFLTKGPLGESHVPVREAAFHLIAGGVVGAVLVPFFGRAGNIGYMFSIFGALIAIPLATVVQVLVTEAWILVRTGDNRDMSGVFMTIFFQLDVLRTVLMGSVGLLILWLAAWFADHALTKALRRYGSQG